VDALENDGSIGLDELRDDQVGLGSAVDDDSEGNKKKF